LIGKYANYGTYPATYNKYDVPKDGYGSYGKDVKGKIAARSAEAQPEAAPAEDNAAVESYDNYGTQHPMTNLVNFDIGLTINRTIWQLRNLPRPANNLVHHL
jgi:hypothetical protein